MSKVVTGDEGHTCDEVQERKHLHDCEFVANLIGRGI